MRKMIAAMLVLALIGASPDPAKPTRGDTNAVLRWGTPLANRLAKQGLAAVRAKDFDRATRLSLALEKAYPTEPARLVISFALSTAFYSPQAAEMFARMATEHAAVLAPPLPLLDPALVRQAMNSATGDGRVRMAQAIIASGWSSAPGSRDQTGARATLIDDSLAHDDVSSALRLLDEIDDPVTLRDFMVFDQYRQLRPAITRRWGADLAELDRFRGETLARAVGGVSPAPLLVAQRVDWLTAHDRAADALAVAKPATAAARTASDSNVRSTFAVASADAAIHLGLYDEAISLLDTTAASLPPRDTGREYVLGVKALMLGDLGRGPEALALATTLHQRGFKDHGWIEASLRRIMVCAAADTGDQARTRRELAALMALGDADTFKAQGLLCLGETEPAVAVVASALRRHKGSEVARRLQIYAQPQSGRWHSRWDAGFAAMRDRPEIRKAMAGYAVVQRFAVSYPDEW